MQEQNYTLITRAEEALERGFKRLEDQRRPDGSWVGELSSSALSTAMSSLALHLRPEAASRSAVDAGLWWLAQTQREDGGWGDSVVDLSNMNSTSIATAVLHCCRPERFEDQVRVGREWVEYAGGFPVLNDPRKTSMSGPGRTMYALAGFYDWNEIRKLPTEVVLLPPKIRRTVSITFSSILSLSILQDYFAPVPWWRRALRRRAVREAVQWLRQAQGGDGAFGESALLAAITVVCLTFADAGGEDIIEKALPFIVESQREDGSWPIDRDLENFDTTQAVYAYHEAEGSVPEEKRVRSWLLGNQSRRPCFQTSSEPGGWAWARPDGWPDMDDTACTLRSLRLLGLPPESEEIRVGLRWLYGMQNSDGSWPTFVRNSKVPFDRGCPYITSQALSALTMMGPEERRSKAVQDALSYLHEHQEADGRFGSLWFRAYTRGTAAVIEAFADLGLVEDETVRRAAGWLKSHQNDDDGWGDGQGAASTAEETGWAVAALLRVDPEQYRGEIERGVEWLLEHQKEDGGWEPGIVGLYFNSVAYSNLSYSLCYPLNALSRYRRSGLVS